MRKMGENVQQGEGSNASYNKVFKIIQQYTSQAVALSIESGSEVVKEKMAIMEERGEIIKLIEEASAALDPDSNKEEEVEEVKVSS